MGHDHAPYASYGLLTGLFNLGAWSLAKALGRSAPGLADLLVMGVATQQVSRTVANDRVTSTVRSPFVDRGPDGDERPKPEGPRRALGELITCPYCLAPWTALAFTAVWAIAPRATRAFSGILAVAAVSDFLNRAYGRVRQEEPREREASATPPAQLPMGRADV